MQASFKRLVVAAGLFALMPAAFAECSDRQLQEIADRFFETTTPSTRAAALSSALKTGAEACPDDPYAQKIAALGQANLVTWPGNPAGEALSYGSEAYAALQRMHASMPMDARTRRILTPTDQSLQINFNDSYDVSKRILEALLSAEAAAGRTAASNPPPQAGDAPIKCDVYQTAVTQEASFWVRNKQDSPGALNIINRAIANCEGNDYNLASIHAHRARASLAMLKRNPARKDAADLLRMTFADVDTLKARRGDARYDWGETDQGELTRTGWAAIASSASSLIVPADQWFAAAHLNRMLTNMSIAAALDDAYAKDIAEAGASNATYRGYRAVLSDAYKRLQALPADEQKLARTSLYTAAKMHADGSWRAEANKQLRKPFDFLYNWIDLNYKPPATASPD